MILSIFSCLESICVFFLLSVHAFKEEQGSVMCLTVLKSSKVLLLLLCIHIEASCFIKTLDVSLFLNIRLKTKMARIREKKTVHLCFKKIL